MTKQQHNSIIIREATIEDILQYKRGKKEVNSTDYYLCQCDCGNYWCPSKKIIIKAYLLVAESIRMMAE